MSKERTDTGKAVRKAAAHFCDWCLVDHDLLDKSTWCALWVDAHSPQEAPNERSGDGTRDVTADGERE
jgi:hypothetical protein